MTSEYVTQSDFEGLLGTVTTLESKVGQLGTDVSELESDIVSLGTDISILQEDVENLEVNVSTLGKQVTKLESDVVSIRNTALTNKNNINDHKNRLKNVEGDVNGHTADIEKLQKILGVGTADNDKYASDLMFGSGLIGTVVDLYNDIQLLNIGSINTDITFLGSSVTDLQNDVKSLRTKSDQNLNRISILEDNFNGFNSTISSINNRLTSIGTLANDAIDAVSAMVSDVTQLQVDCADNKTQIGSVVDYLDKVAKIQIGFAQDDISDLQTDVQSLQNDINSNTSYITTLNETASDHANEIEELNDLTSSHTTEINRLRGTVSGHTSTINSMSTQLSSHTTEINKLGSDIYDLNLSTAALGASILDINKEIEGINGEVADLKKLTEDNRLTMVDLGTRFTNLDDWVTDLAQRLTNTDVRMNTIDEGISNLQEQDGYIYNAIGNLGTDISNLDDKFTLMGSTLADSIDFLQSEISINIGSINTNTVDIEAIRDNLSSNYLNKEQLLELIPLLDFEEYGKLKETVHNNTTLVANLDSRASILNSNVNYLQESNRGVLNNITELKDKILGLQSNSNTLTNELTNISREIGSHSIKLDKHDNDIVRLGENVDSNAEKIRGIVNELNINYAKKSDIPKLPPMVSVEDFNNLKKTVTINTTSISNHDSKYTNIDTRVNALASKLSSDISRIETNLGTYAEDIANLSDIVSLNSTKISDVANDLVNNYVKKEDIPNLPDYDPGVDVEEFNNLKSSVTANTNAVAEVSDRIDGLNATTNSTIKYVQDEISSTKGLVVSSVSGLQHNIEELTKKTDELAANCDELNNTTQDHTNKLDGWEETIDGSVIQHKGLVEDLSDFKQHVEDTYAKPEDISSLLNNYSPDVSNKNKWVGVETAGDLVGKTGEEIALERYTYNSIFDQIIFADYEPTVSEPSANVALKDDWSGEMNIDWYDEAKRIILVKDGSVGPDGGDFYPANVKDAMISYPKNITLDPHFTNGPILKSDTKQSSVGFCKIQNESGEWDYYKKDNNIYHVPATLSTGEYRYYMATYFTKGSPAINNNGLTIKEWNENIPIESEDYITIIASKPTYYSTLDGEVENPLQPWSDNMVDTMELLPSCQCPQQFRTPKPLKHLYIWNDLVGGYARVPSEDGVPAYMIRTVDEDGYYKYSYDSNTFGHRGGIKVKIEF